MARRCGITGKGVLAGNNVSHANNKTRRRFLPNLRSTSLMSEALGHMVSMRITANAIRTIEFKGGLDTFLLNANTAKMSLEMRQLKKRIAKVVEAQASA